MRDTSAPEANPINSFNLRPGMVAEVMTPDNHLLFVGRVDKVQDTGVCIRETNDDTLPMVLVNKPLKVCFFRDTDKIVLQGKVCGSTIRMWKVDRLSSTFTRDMRAYFRQNISLDIAGRCGKRTSRGGRPEAQFPCKVLDISAGGIQISSAEVYMERDRLLINSLPLVAGAAPFSFDCQVRWAGERRAGVSRYGCQFDSLSSRDQDRLLQAIFTIQREEIKRRKAR